MAISYAMVKRDPTGNKTIVDITLDGSYSAGGYALDNTQLGLVAAADNIDCTYVHATATSTFRADYVPSTNKIIICSSNGAAPAALAEVAAAQVTSSHKIRATCHGAVRL